jgi:hypothetical protein
MITDAPWYVSNLVLRRDLHLLTVKEEISQRTSHYSDRLRTHPNYLTSQLTHAPEQRRLKRYKPYDLLTRFQVLQ